jgi:hypothetical protein
MILKVGSEIVDWIQMALDRILYYILMNLQVYSKSNKLLRRWMTKKSVIFSDVSSKEYIVSIFRVEEWPKQHTSMKQASNKASDY